MSSSLASDLNDPHQSPIWIKAGTFLGIPALGTSVPHTIFGTKPCPKNYHRIYGSALAVQTQYSSRFGRNVNNDGRPGCPIRLYGCARPHSGSSRPPKLNPETYAWRHTVFDVSTSSRWLLSSYCGEGVIRLSDNIREGEPIVRNEEFERFLSSPWNKS